MAEPRINVSADVAERIKESLNEQEFSLPFQAVRAWAPYATAEDLEQPTVFVVPGDRELSRGSRRFSEHRPRIDVTIERQLGGQTGETEREDELAALAQEVEDFLWDPDNMVAIGDRRVTPIAIAIDWDRERLLTERVFRTVISVTYSLLRELPYVPEDE